jgi:type IV pilus assembly protein PilN
VIRINLLEETRQQVKAKGGGPKFQMAGSAGVIVLGIGVAAAIAAVLVYLMILVAKIQALDADVEKAQVERARLEYVIKRDEELRKKKDELNRKIGIIAELKRKQDLPVKLMDMVSRNLADFVWLEDLTFTGDLVTVRGKAQTPIALANFLRNLEDSKFFRDVAMNQVKNDEATGLTTFDFTTTFNPSGQLPEAKVPEKRPPA